MDYATDHKYWVVDARDYPVVLVQGLESHMPDGALVASIDAAIDVLSSLSGDFVMVHDDRLTKNMTPRQRKLITQAHLHPVYQRCRGDAFVLGSVVMQGVLTALFWVRSTPRPHRVFTRLEPAISWAHSLLGSGTQRENAGK